MKIKIKLFSLVVTILIISNVGVVKGQNYIDALRLSEPGLTFDARSLGMGNSYTALSNNLAGIHLNPAGLGLVSKSEISFGFNNLSVDNKSNLFGRVTGNEITETKFGSFGMLAPFNVRKGSFVIGFSYNKIKDFSRTNKFNGFNSGDNSLIQFLTSNEPDIAYKLGLSYEDYDDENNYLGDKTRINGNLTQKGDLLEEGSIDSYALSGAMEIGRNMFAGVTIEYLSGDYKSRRNYFEDDTENFYGPDFLLDPSDETTGGFEYLNYRDRLDWEISGLGFRAGFLYKLNKYLQLGASLKMPTIYEIKEVYEVDASSGFANASFRLDETFYSSNTYKIRTPAELNFGMALRGKLYILSADLQFIDYTQMEFSSGLTGEERYFNNREIDDIFRVVTNASVGAEYLIMGLKTKVRGGFIYRKSPYKNDPAKYDKKFVTLGAGVLLASSFTVDMAFVYGWWEDLGDNYDSGVSRTYQKLKNKNLIITASYRL